jgi:hypothetical protein
MYIFRGLKEVEESELLDFALGTGEQERLKKIRKM